jgi:ABC-type uncharacterized transport system substrate-binding protein
MDRLERHYAEEAGYFGVAVKMFNECPVGLFSRIGNARALILFTNKVSHRARREVMNAARSRRIPVLMCHSCGVCTFRNCLKCLMNKTHGREEKH